MVVVVAVEFQRTKVCFNWIPLVLGGRGQHQSIAAPPAATSSWCDSDWVGCSVCGRPQIGVSDGEVLNSPAWHLQDEQDGPIKERRERRLNRGRKHSGLNL